VLKIAKQSDFQVNNKVKMTIFFLRCRYNLKLLTFFSQVRFKQVGDSHLGGRVVGPLINIFSPLLSKNKFIVTWQAKALMTPQCLSSNFAVLAVFEMTIWAQFSDLLTLSG